MIELKWVVNEQNGSLEIKPGRNHVEVCFTRGTVITRAEAYLSIPSSPKMFFNGFQTWTHSPELTASDKIRGLHGFPKFGFKALGLDHFADYHFFPYPHRRGILHGFSYCYFRNADSYTLIASLDEKPGYTMLTYDSEKQQLKLERDCIGVEISGETFSAFDIFYAVGSESEVFDGWFDALGIHNKVPKIKGYSSWYDQYQNINAESIMRDLSGACKIFDEGDLFQIDDGWETRVGDWEIADSRKFPNGLTQIAAKIHENGFKAGLWLAPFVCEKKSRLFREHPEWLLRYKGAVWKNGPNWGGSYSLDFDQPEVQDYLERVFERIFNKWDFDLVKLDFLYAAAPHPTGDHGDEKDQPFTESRASRMIRALSFLRKCCGEKLILGCGVPVMPAFGLVDYCRVGADMSLDWDDRFFMRILHRERVSTRQSINNTIFRRQLDRRAFGNDPDVFFLRDRNLSLSPKQKDYLASVNALLGSVWLTSDDLSAYDEKKIQRYRHYAELRNAEDIHIDPDDLSIRFKLNEKDRMIYYPAGKMK